MADEEAAAATDESSWWGPNAIDEAPLPAASFEEPVVWSDAIEWPDTPVDAVVADLPVDEALGLPDADLVIPPAPAPDPALVPPPVDDEADFRLEPLPESIWAAEPSTGLVFPSAEPDAGLSGSIWDPAPPDVASSPAPGAAAPVAGFYEDAARPERGGRSGARFYRDHATAAVIGLLALAAVVLVGLVFSVRNRADTGAASSSQAGATPAAIVTQGLPTPTVPLTTTTIASQPTTTVSVPAPLPPDSVPAADGSPQAGAGAGTAPRAPATTSPPPRAAAPSAGSTTPPATSPPTTRAPAPPDTSPPDTAPPATTPPATTPDTVAPPVTTRPRPTVPDIPIPTMPTTTVATDLPTVTTPARRTTP